MALTEISYPERVLIVLNADGTLKGAHQERLREIRDGDVLITASMLPAEPVAAETLAAILPSGTLAAQVQSLIGQLTTYQTAEQSLTEQVGTLTSEKTAVEAVVVSLQGQLATAQARIAELEAPSSVIDGVPQRVTPYQARVALLQAGLLPQVEAMVTQAGGAVLIAWEYATVIERGSPFIAQLVGGLGLTDEQVDALFVAAAGV